MLTPILVLLCTVFRIVPHPPNVAPVGATAVLAGRTMSPGAAVALTLAAMAISDLALAAIHGWPPFSGQTPFVYAGFTAQVAIARALRRVRGGAIAAAIVGATAFFAISNLGLWALGMYPRTAAGLVACYTMALPFFTRTLVGDVAWTIALVLVWRWIARRRADPQVAEVAAL
jgi:hypothetical protein